MPVNLQLDNALPVAGVELVTVSAGLKKDGSSDLVLFSLADSSNCAAVFTRSAFCAAPVTISRSHLDSSQGRIRALLVNSGNANAGTGQPGIAMAEGHCETVAQVLSVSAQAVLPFSTGVIGQLLPDEIMKKGIRTAAQQLSENDCNTHSHWQAAARGIMTTDTQPKITSKSVSIGAQSVTITGMAKGAGMIQPNMATMLSYVFTDAAIGVEDLNTVLREVVDVSFNAITVDSDTSTNDSLVLVATGVGMPLSSTDEHWQDFKDALTRVCLDLAQAIIRDAEGATKFITVNVSGGVDVAECKRVGYAIANSPLVKTAMFASDANVGRLLMAIGKADVDALDPAGVSVSLGDVLVFVNAGIAPGYTEALGAEVMARAEIDVNIDLSRGPASAAIYTCDLSHDYVSINADYRS